MQRIDGVYHKLKETVAELCAGMMVACGAGRWRFGGGARRHAAARLRADARLARSRHRSMLKQSKRGCIIGHSPEREMSRRRGQMPIKC